jgi:1-acyl-sn-glycerol-3-phosphate acyltransferase
MNNKINMNKQKRKLNIFQITFCGIRTTILRLCLFIASLIWLPIGIISFPVSWKIRIYTYRYWGMLALYLARIICGIRYEIKGKENLKGLSLKNKKAVVFISNHQSAWETTTFMGILTPMVYVLKKNLFLIPFFGLALILTKQIGINRSQKIESFKKVIKAGKDRLSKGISVLIFPEGTRIQPFTRVPFHKSAANLAKSAKVPIIPIAINSGFCWPGKKFIAYPGKVTVIIGQKIETDNITSKQAHEKATKWILEHMEQFEKGYINQIKNI